MRLKQWIMPLVMIVFVSGFVTHPVYMPFGYKKYFFWKSSFGNPGNKEDKVVITPELQSLILENHKAGNEAENKRIVRALLGKGNITLKADEVCWLDLNTWKLVISKLKKEGDGNG